MFESVNKAYEFLCSKSAKRTEGPDPDRIVLLLQTQSILFKRYAEGNFTKYCAHTTTSVCNSACPLVFSSKVCSVASRFPIIILPVSLYPVLKPYKYAGYPMLITTISRESSDDDLFSKSAPILTAASEVAFHTMNTSALNAEELRREEGIGVRGVCVCVCCVKICDAQYTRRNPECTCLTLLH